MANAVGNNPNLSALIAAQNSEGQVATTPGVRSLGADAATPFDQLFSSALIGNQFALAAPGTSPFQTQNPQVLQTGTRESDQALQALMAQTQAQTMMQGQTQNPAGPGAIDPAAFTQLFVMNQDQETQNAQPSIPSQAIPDANPLALAQAVQMVQNQHMAEIQSQNAVAQQLENKVMVDNLAKIAGEVSQHIANLSKQDPTSRTLTTGEVDQIISESLFSKAGTFSMDPALRMNGEVKDQSTLYSIQELADNLKQKGLSERAIDEVSGKLGALLITAKGAQIEKAMKQQAQTAGISGEAYLSLQQTMQGKKAMNPQGMDSLNQILPQQTIESNAMNLMAGMESGSEGMTGQDFSGQAQWNILNGMQSSNSPQSGSSVVVEASLMADGKLNTESLEAKISKMVDYQSKLLIRKGGGEVRIQLRPDHLGDITLKVNTQNSNVNVELITQSAEVKDLLMSKMDDLRGNLAGQDLKLAQIQIDVSSSKEGSQGQNHQQGHKNPWNQGGQGQDQQMGQNQKQNSHQEFKQHFEEFDSFGGRGSIATGSNRLQQRHLDQATKAARSDSSLNLKV